jgi:hypothetical protein
MNKILALLKRSYDKKLSIKVDVNYFILNDSICLSKKGTNLIMSTLSTSDNNLKRLIPDITERNELLSKISQELQEVYDKLALSLKDTVNIESNNDIVLRKKIDLYKTSIQILNNDLINKEAIRLNIKNKLLIENENIVKFIDNTTDPKSRNSDKGSFHEYNPTFKYIVNEMNNKFSLLKRKNIDNNNHLFVNNFFTNKKELIFNNLNFEQINVKQESKPPELSFNLNAVVTKPGIYKLDDLITAQKLKHEMRYLSNLPKPEEIDFANLDTYMNPFEDERLHKIVKEKNKLFCSSTSGISSTLSHFFYKLSNFKSPHFYGLSEEYLNESLKFMVFQRKPTVVKLTKHNDFYSISSSKIFEDKNEFILLKMGKYMEKLLTSNDESFQKKYMKRNENNKVEINQEEDYFNFVGFDKFLLRSQIDCGTTIKDAETGLDKKIVFEIKTRACSPIRYDVHNYLDYIDYEITKIKGPHSSYEREYYDLIRGAFLKYLFQMKIGGMDGAFIAYHNTQKIYGFEYVKLKEIEERIFGNCLYSDIIFKSSLKLIQESFSEIIKNYPNKDKLYFGIYANQSKGTIDILVEVAPESDIYDNVFRDNFIFIDNFYTEKNYKPNVDKYSITISSSLNNLISTFTPILFEKGDTFDVKYSINYLGKVNFDEYMKFLHEAYYFEENNVENEYVGLWSQELEKH